MAGQVLRLQHLQPTQDKGEADIHAPEPRQSWLSTQSFALAMELGEALRTRQVRRREGRLDQLAVSCPRRPDRVAPTTRCRGCNATRGILQHLMAMIAMVAEKGL